MISRQIIRPIPETSSPPYTLTTGVKLELWIMHEDKRIRLASSMKYHLRFTLGFYFLRSSSCEKKKCYIFIRCKGCDGGISKMLSPGFSAGAFYHPRLFLINFSVTSFVKISDERVHPCDDFTSWVPFSFPPLWISTDTCKVYVLLTLLWFSPFPFFMQINFQDFFFFCLPQKKKNQMGRLGITGSVSFQRIKFSPFQKSIFSCLLPNTN